MEPSQKNTYMEEVLQNQQVVAQELKRKSAPASMAQAPMRQRMQMPGGGGGPEHSRAVDVRITGFWRFKTVIVPPNVWVVHTRRGREQPMRVGLGTSFRYNPYTDTFIVAPATMQTLMINARCIGKERQGIMVQAYVQWIIEDFKAAYQKFDFSDVDDPTRIVNVQLREQAEASIKDKVATMGIDDVLADKSPIIQDLTTRLRQLAEGQGLKIVTVQIKEAIISSTRLFENLQQPFREEQQKVAKLAEIDRTTAVHHAEHKSQVDAFELKRAEERRRQQIEQKAEQERVKEQEETTRVKKASEIQLHQSELERIASQRKVDDANAAALLQTEKATLEKARVLADVERLKLELETLKRKIDNDISPARLDEILVRNLPQLVQHMPKPEHVETVHISGNGSVPDAVLSLTGLVKGLRSALKDDHQ